MFTVLYLGLSGLPNASGDIAENAAYRLELRCGGATVYARLADKVAGVVVADGPLVYRASHGSEAFTMLDGASVERIENGLALRGKLAGLDVEHTFTLRQNRPILEERIVITNRTGATAALSDLEIGFARRVDGSGEHAEATAGIANDRWVAVPLRHRATDPKGFFSDFSMMELLEQPGWEPTINGSQQYRQVPSRHHVSEGWAWLHGRHALGIFKFSQECMQFSVVSQLDEQTLRLGGACMISGEPAALTRLGPGESVDLGITRYETVSGGYEQAAYAFRRMLDEQGCRFPKDYNPPVHWEQLYDMEGAWDARPARYTKAIVEKEAEKGRQYGCEALYLDPGWDTEFASFLWGEEWLGARKQFVEEMRSKYGLAVSLHCPLATWMSSVVPMGPSAVDGWPQAARRTVPESAEMRVPAVQSGRRNLALLAGAKPSASSVFAGGKMSIHQIDHLNDGWYGNSASWIAGELPCWAEVDLGDEYRVSEVALGNEHFGAYTDRAATELRILVATKHGEWHVVAEHKGGGLTGTRSFAFPPVSARWVRVEITRAEQGLPRLDEIEVYEAEPISGEFAARRGPRPDLPPTEGRLCLGSKQYLDEAERRLLANCADGVAFLMFDGNWWNGGCDNPDHGHPVRYRWEDHIRASLELAQRVHAKYPKVLIEMHDMLAGGSSARPTPVYYKYGLPGSYDDNWGFELMWDPMADLREGRGAALYYYNLGCNIPVYLHIDLRKDNRECVALWWYASTCRHLGIGGTHADPEVVRAQQAAMRWYHEHEEFYKRGDFYGPNEQVHLHVLPAQKAFVVNLFNLSDEERTVSGSVRLADVGLDPAAVYTGPEPWGSGAAGEFRVALRMPPWSARVAQFQGTSPN